MASNHKTILGNPKGLKINDKISASIPVLISCLMKHAIAAIKVKLDNRPKHRIGKIMVTGNKIIRITHLIL